MAVPRNKTSYSAMGTRRSHHAKDPVETSNCLNCGAGLLPFHACKSCGKYYSNKVKKAKLAPLSVIHLKAKKAQA